MRATFEHLDPTFPLTWRYARLDADRFEPYWHFHAEFELTFIVRGSGTRLVGDSAEEYQAGDLVLIGPNLPHTYVSAPGNAANEAVVVHFTRDFLAPGVFDVPAFAPVASMLDAASAGLWFATVPCPIPSFGDLPPAERTVELLRLLVAMSRANHVRLATGGRSPALDRAVARRVEAMVDTIHSQYQSRLTLGTIARAAVMNPSAASRLFTRCTGSTVTRYLNLVRVNAACRLLRDTDQAVASVAMESGYANLSNFNRRFRDVKRMSPSEYRARFQVELSEPASR